MPGHVYISLSGFSLHLLPFTPFRAGQGEAGPASLDILHFAATGDQFARVTADGNGGFTSNVDQNTSSVYDVVEISTGPALPKWIIETSVFTCDWPVEYEVASSTFPQEATIIDLFGSNQEQIYIQTCGQIPTLRQMPVRGQRIVSIDDSAGSIELQYIHQNLPWYQRHQVVPLGEQALLVSCQAPHPLASSVRAAAQSVVRSMLFTPDQG